MYNKKIIVLSFILALIVGFELGWAARGVFSPKIETQTITEEKPVIQEKVVTQTKTQIQYVDKNIDAVTGKQEKTDVEFAQEQPAVHVKVNAQDHQFALKQGETQKFENGKLLLEQSSQITLDIKIPEYKQKWRVGAYGEYNSEEEWRAGLRLNRQFNGWDFDASINHDKKIGVMVTKWF